MLITGWEGWSLAPACEVEYQRCSSSEGSSQSSRETLGGGRGASGARGARVGGGRKEPRAGTLREDLSVSHLSVHCGGEGGALEADARGLAATAFS